MSIKRMLESLRRSWRRSMERRRTLRELAACPPNELRRIASDVSLPCDDLRLLCRRDRGDLELLPQRLQLLGIDPEFVRQDAPTLFKDLARVCASCQASRQCARDMAHGDVQAGMTTYCPNNPAIDLLTVGRSSVRHAMDRGA